MLLSDFMNDDVPGDDGYGGMHPVLYDAILHYKMTGERFFGFIAQYCTIALNSSELLTVYCTIALHSSEVSIC